MKLFRHVALATALTLSAFGAITYTSCTKDPCNNVSCYNGGSCSGGNCYCPSGFIGSNCEQSVFVGTWNGADICTSATYTITVSISSSSTSTNILVANPGGFGQSVVISGVLSSDGTTATFINQDAGGGRTLNGTMTLSSPTEFSFSYDVTSLVSPTDDCQGEYTKQ